MGMSGVQVLGRGSGACNRGPTQLYALPQARQEGTTTGRPLHPQSSPPDTIPVTIRVNEAARRQ